MLQQPDPASANFLDLDSALHRGEPAVPPGGDSVVDLDGAGPAMATDTQPPLLRLLVRLPSGALMPVHAPTTALAAELMAALLGQCAWPAAAVARAGLALAGMALVEDRSLVGNGVEDGDTLAVFERRP